MSMDQAADAILQAAGEDISLDELSDVDQEGSSSLSDIDPDEKEEASEDASDDENDSEAETERLEESPNKYRTHHILNPQNHNQTYEGSPSKLKQIAVQDDDDDEEEEEEEEEGEEEPEPGVDEESDEENSGNESPKSPPLDEPENEPLTAATSLQDSAGEGKKSLSIMHPDTKKRKRSIMAGEAFEEDEDQPSRKRTGSVLTPADEYAIEEDTHQEEEADISHPISGNVSVDEVEPAQEEDAGEDAEDPVAEDEIAPELPDALTSPKKRGRKKKKATENGVDNHEDADTGVEGDTVMNGDLEVRNGDEDHADNEGDDEAEAALKNEEELEKKRIALDQLTTIERQFATFRDRLYDERLEQLNREEEMLRQDNPTHPEYLAMMECIDARRDARIRVADNLRDLEIESLRITSVAKRSQILSQYQQEVRAIREKKLEQLGKQWYEIQHDRRSYAGSVPDYALRYPTRKPEQISNQRAYSSEVSILSGIAKYVGFPAAPPMAAATTTELEDDLEKMGRVKQAQHVLPTGLPLQELVALRSVGSTSRFKPAEEQFIEQTPWANPQHPSHAHLLQRQASAQQTPRTTSPFSQVQVQPRRHSHQHGSGVPISGTFSTTSTPLLHHSSNGVSMSGGRISPHNPFGNSSHSHVIAPSPLGSRQTSLSPQQNRHPSAVPDQHNVPPTQDVPKSNGAHHSPPIGHSEGPRDFPHDVRREAASMMSRF